MPRLGLVVKDIRKAVADLLGELETPEGVTEIKKIYAEPPGDTVVHPCFIVNSRGLVGIGRSPSTRRSRLLIEIQLLFAQASEEYGDREKWDWVVAVLNHFDANLTLRGKTSFSEISAVDAEAVLDYNGPYMAATFDLHALVSEVFDFAG